MAGYFQSVLSTKSQNRRFTISRDLSGFRFGLKTSSFRRDNWIRAYVFRVFPPTLSIFLWPSRRSSWHRDHCFGHPEVAVWGGMKKMTSWWGLTDAVEIHFRASPKRHEPRARIGSISTSTAAGFLISARSCGQLTLMRGTCPVSVIYSCKTYCSCLHEEALLLWNYSGHDTHEALSISISSMHTTQADWKIVASLAKTEVVSVIQEKSSLFLLFRQVWQCSSNCLVLHFLFHVKSFTLERPIFSQRFLP